MSKERTLLPKSNSQFLYIQCINCGSEQIVYTHTTVIIKSMRVVNTTGTAATLKLFHDGTAAVNLILPFVTIAANGWAEFDGTIIMEAGDTLVGISGTDEAINLTVYGLELT